MMKIGKNSNQELDGRFGRYRIGSLKEPMKLIKSGITHAFEEEFVEK